MRFTKTAAALIAAVAFAGVCVALLPASAGENAAPSPETPAARKWDRDVVDLFARLPVQDLHEYECTACERTWLVARPRRQAKVVQFPTSTRARARRRAGGGGSRS